MQKTKTILSLAIAIVMLFSIVAFGAEELSDMTRFTPSAPTLTASGSTALCEARVRKAGASINALLELYQGSTLVAWWTTSGTGYVTFSETAPFTSGLTYTLTISGTADGVEFTPNSVTKTLW